MITQSLREGDPGKDPRRGHGGSESEAIARGGAEGEEEGDRESDARDEGAQRSGEGGVELARRGSAGQWRTRRVRVRIRVMVRVRVRVRVKDRVRIRVRGVSEILR